MIKSDHFKLNLNIFLLISKLCYLLEKYPKIGGINNSFLCRCVTAELINRPRL